MVDRYVEYLNAARITVTVRRSRGKDIDAPVGNWPIKINKTLCESVSLSNESG